MAVYQQPSPAGKLRWMVDFAWVDPNTGRKRRIRRAAKDDKGRPCRSQTASEKSELDIRKKLAAGTFEPESEPEPVESAEGTKLADYFEKTYLPDARVRLKPQTVDYLERTFKNSVAPTVGAMVIDAIDTSAVASLTRVLHERELSAKSINNALSALRATLAHAVEHGALATLPRVRWQKVPPTSFDFFTFEETALLLPVAPPLVVIALRTGMRIGELLALRWSDVSIERKLITVSRSVYWEKGGKRIEGAPKNNRSRTIPLTSDALAALEALPGRNASPYVFADPAGSPLPPTACKWPIWRAQDAAKLRRTGPHVLRHTFASHLVMRGASLPAVQALMGHSTIQMTMKYAHLAPDHLRSAIEMLT